MEQQFRPDLHMWGMQGVQVRHRMLQGVAYKDSEAGSKIRLNVLGKELC